MPYRCDKMGQMVKTDRTSPEGMQFTTAYHKLLGEIKPECDGCYLATITAFRAAGEVAIRSCSFDDATVEVKKVTDGCIGVQPGQVLLGNYHKCASDISSKAAE